MRRLVFCVVGLGMVTGACDSRAEIRAPLPEWHLTDEPTVAIGGSDERAEYLLERVADATRLSDGRIVIADAGSSEVRYFDPHGAHLLTATREGEGPGEVQGIIDIARLPGDTIAILSYRPGITYLDPDGRYLRTEPVSLWDLTDSCHLAEGAIWLMPNRNILAVADENRGIPGCPAIASGVHRGEALVLQFDPRESRADSLAVLPGTERNGIHHRIFAALLLSASNQDFVFLADTRGDSIRRVELRGNATSHLSMPFEPRPIPTKARTEVVRKWEQPDGTIQISDAYNYPDFLPRAARILPDVADGLWVAGFPEPTTALDPIFLDRLYMPLGFEAGFEWRALTADGTAVGTVRTPPRHFVLEVGADYVLGVTWDEFEVQRVELRELSRQPAP